MFWHLTPRQLHAHFKGANLRIEREQTLALSQAWHVAALSRMKKLPALEKMLPSRKSVAAQTPKQVEISALQLAVAWGASPEQISMAKERMQST